MSVVIEKGIPFGQAGERQLLLDLARPDPRPDGPAPAVVHIHGGGWEAGERGLDTDVTLAQHGFLFVSIDYRLSQEASFPAQIHDAKAAVRWLRAHAGEYHVNPNRIGVGGHSAGGHLAALLGTSGEDQTLEGDSGSPGYSSAVQAVFAASAPLNFLAEDFVARDDADAAEARMLGGTVSSREDVARTASPLHGVKPDLPPFLLVHGARDDVVPVTQSRSFYAALLDSGVDAAYLELAQGTHGLEGYWPEIRQVMLAFFRLSLA